MGEATQGDLADKADLAGLASKVDLAAVRTVFAELRTEFKTEIAAVRSEMAEMKADLLKWIIGAVAFQTVVILGAVVSLIKIFAK